MKKLIANAPCSWGIEFADNPDNTAWQTVLDEIRDAGYAATELGPLHYLPTNTQMLTEALSQRQLQLVAGTLFDKFHDSQHRNDVINKAKLLCGILEKQQAPYLVIIDHVTSPRSDFAGQPNVAPRLPLTEWKAMMHTLKTVGEICCDHGITPTLHPHAGTFIEYEDEIQHVMHDIPSDYLSLCIDTGHSAYASMRAEELLLSYKDRVKYLHFKDIDPFMHRVATENNMDFYTAIFSQVFCPLGKGVVDFQAIKQAMQKIQFDGWITVEQDTDPKNVAEAKSNAIRSREFIEQHILT